MGYGRFLLLLVLWAVALMSGSFSIFRELYGIYSGTIPARSLFWSCSLIAFVVSAGILWVVEHGEKNSLKKRLESLKPNLKLSLEGVIYVYDTSLGITVFFLNAYLLNAGEPTIAKSWDATYLVGTSTETMNGSYIRDSYSVTIGRETVTLTNDSLLIPKVLADSIPKGGGKVGRLVFTLPGDRGQQVKSCQYKITVSCYDFEGTKVEATFSPGTAPVDGLKTLPGEKLSVAVAQADVENKDIFKLSE